MAPHEIIELEAQVNALDRETAERVTRLVFECSASLDLASWRSRMQTATDKPAKHSPARTTGKNKKLGATSPLQAQWPISMSLI